MMREYVPLDGGRKPIRIRRGKKDPIPNIWICFPEVKRYGGAGNTGRGPEKRMGVVVGITERVMFE